MHQTFKNYAAGIVAGNTRQIAATFSTAIKIKAPGSNQAHEGKVMTSTMLSTAATVISDFKLVRFYTSDNTWALVLLEGFIDDKVIQIIDHVHIDELGLIDQVDIFMRPASLGETLLQMVTTETQRRMLP